MLKIMLWTAAAVIALSLMTLTVSAQDTLDEDMTHITAVAWSSDGSKLAVVGIRHPMLEGYVRIFDVETGESLYAVNPNPGGFTSVDWSPDDRFIAAGGYDQVVWIFDVETRAHVASLWGHQSTVTAVDWNADGTQLVSAGNWDQKVILWDMKNHSILTTVEAGDIKTAVYSPDHQWIAVGSIFGLGIFPSNLDTSGEVFPLPEWVADHTIASIAWSEDGRYLAYSVEVFPSVINPARRKQGKIIIIDQNTDEIIAEIMTGTESSYGIEWIDSDRLLATQSIDGVVQIWDVISGNPVQQFAGVKIFASQISTSPYGGRLAYGRTIDSNSDTRPFQIIIPQPSLERLAAISALCVRDGDARAESLTDSAPNSLDDLPAFVAQIEALPDDAIPSACRADLLAVASALGE